MQLVGGGFEVGHCVTPKFANKVILRNGHSPQSWLTDSFPRNDNLLARHIEIGASDRTILISIEILIAPTRPAFNIIIFIQ